MVVSFPKSEQISLTTGGTVQLLWSYRKIVDAIVIQNISTEDVTIFTDPGQTASTSIILNAADAVGKGGGMMVFPYIEGIKWDLSELRFIRATAGLTFAALVTVVK